MLNGRFVLALLVFLLGATVSADVERTDYLQEARELRGSAPRQALSFLDRGLEASPMPLVAAEYHLLRGQILRDLGELGEAREDSERAREIAEAELEPVLVGRALRLRGTIHAEGGDLGAAMSDFLDARDRLEGTPGRLYLARVTLALGGGYQMLEDHESALPFFQRALALGRELENEGLMFGALHNQALSIGELKGEAEGLPYHRQALELASETGRSSMIAHALATLCQRLVAVGNYAEAEQVCERARDLTESLEQVRLRAGVELGLADLAYARGQSEQAMALYRSALSLAEGRVPTVEREVLPKLSELYEAEGDYQQALALYRRYLTLRDELIEEERRRHLMALTVEQQIAEREREIAVLTLDRELQAALLERRNWMLVGSLLGLVLISLLAMLVWRHYRARARRSEALAGRDPLTGLLNRRGFELVSKQEAQRAQREGYSLVVGLADIDHFKPVNDRHGHPVGDEALKVIAARLQEGVRGMDSVVRWGGEEFLLLFSGADRHVVYQVVERLRARISEEGVPTSAGPLSLTMTFGLAEVDSDMQAAIAAADKALYEGKQSGRDRIVMAD